MIGILGGGAFGTALAVSLAHERREVRIWARDTSVFGGRRSARLPGVELPESVSVVGKIDEVSVCDVLLLALPMQSLGGFLAEHRSELDGRPLVACCKGVDLVTLRGPTALINSACPSSVPCVLTGPSFAADIARGLPTALTLACSETGAGEAIQRLLSTGNLRIYRTTDVIGAELGGALKNVIAIACGLAIGAGLGESARAALLTRGYAEMLRLSLALGAKAETLAGLSGLGDLVLTCTSEQSRNFRYGHSLGSGRPFDRSLTVEGVPTAAAVVKLAGAQGIEMPIAAMVTAMAIGRVTLDQAVQTLLSRPLKQE
jgi:glycerol-3-phosphate dehydrogenase (NAD(P)+)